MIKYLWIILGGVLIIVGFFYGKFYRMIPQNTIRMNQIGFYPQAPKIAVIEGDVTGSFYLTSDDKSDSVYTGNLSETSVHKYGSRIIHIADFSSYRQKGTYRLLVPGVGYSYPFKIKPHVYKEVADALIKGFYFQRASAYLPPKHAGRWSRKEGHPDDNSRIHASAAAETRAEEPIIHAAKGWYDAGDYNKYIVNSGITMGTLLSFYEDFPDYARSIESNVPESNNEIPDLLDEILWNLRWMMTMQDPEDAGVYHKLTSPGFAGMVMPDQDRDARYVVQKGTAATLDFAAVMAQAGRVFDSYRKQLPGLSDSCFKAAKRAWQWARKNPDVVYDQKSLNQKFNPDITTGAYGDRNFGDEWIWAAAELYAATGDESYVNVVDMIPEEEMSLPSWNNTQALGYYTLLRFRKKLSGTIQQESVIEQMVKDFADKLVEGGSVSAYQTVMGLSADNFIWGSNSVAANQSIALIQAYKLTADKNYINYALSNLDYLLGRNGTGYSFVTGYGDKTPMHPHHRPSEADGIREPVPGLLVGGPNKDQQDGCNYSSDIPDQSYVDDVCSYASNEIAINWNAPMVYLSGALEALQNEVGYSVN